MTKRMLVDATHPEETRVAIVESHRDVNRLEDLDFGLASKPLLKGNIYLAKVMRVEPSLQAAFVDYGGNRHGFLSFSEIHPDYFRIPMSDRSGEETFEEDGIYEQPTGAYDDQPQMEASSYADEQDIPSGESREESNEQPVTEASQPSETAPVAETAPESVQPVETPVVSEEQAALVVEATTGEAAPEAVTADVSVEAPIAAPAEPIILPPAPHPLDGIAQAAETGETDHDVGLITDFGNAVVETSAPEEMAAADAQPVESIGGEVSERFVRRPPARPRYKIQEVVKRGMVMLVQVVKEERGNKGAALTTFLSLAGRYCVLMPNTDHGGGVSRKITNHQDRRRMKEILDQLEIPEGMAVILRTAGMEQDPPEIQRDLEYLLRLWNSIREQTLQSTAPALIYEEANLIKRSVRDLYSHDINEILVSGEDGYEKARDFMRTIMPDQVEKIKLYRDPIPLFFRYNVESQIDTLHTPVVQLRSGGYLVINPTEALVSIDVNSGRATRERHIEETAVKTNLEAADEVARQLRLRDLAGLVVIDFIDMEDNRNNTAVERRLKEAMKNDRARLQIGRLSPFGLMELSRQRLRPSLQEINFEKCPHCAGVGLIRSVDSAALSVLRVIEEEGIKQRASEITITVATQIALYLLNQKRADLTAIEQRYEMRVMINNDDSLVPPEYKMEKSKNRQGGTAPRLHGPAVNSDQILADTDREMPHLVHAQVENDADSAEEKTFGQEGETTPRTEGEKTGNRRRRFRERGTAPRRDRRPGRDNTQQAANNDEPNGNVIPAAEIQGEMAQPVVHQNNKPTDESTEGQPNQDGQRRRRRGRRGGRRRSGTEGPEGAPERRPRFSEDGTSAPVPFDRMDGPMPVIPTSIHELDTTPRDPALERRYREPTQQAQAPAPSGSPHEIVNPPTDKPKGGWWRRLTGQEN